MRRPYLSDVEDRHDTELQSSGSSFSFGMCSGCVGCEIFDCCPQCFVSFTV